MARLVLGIFVVVTCLVFSVEGHGYLLTPPQRDSVWRAEFNTPRDNTETAYQCGGREVQHGPNGGKCGVCGEEFSKSDKKLEPGPSNIYATGLITANYQQGQTIDVSVMLTEYNKGYMEFRLCENNVPQRGRDASVAVDQTCFDQNVLMSPSGDTKFPASSGISTYRVVLRPGVTCRNCVLQWRYRAGNNWGCDNGVCGSGLGPQEETWGCSDIAIHQSWSATPPITPVILSNRAKDILKPLSTPAKVSPDSMTTPAKIPLPKTETDSTSDVTSTTEEVLDSTVPKKLSTPAGSTKRQTTAEQTTLNQATTETTDEVLTTYAVKAEHSATATKNTEVTKTPEPLTTESDHSFEGNLTTPAVITGNSTDGNYTIYEVTGNQTSVTAEAERTTTAELSTTPEEPAASSTVLPTVAKTSVYATSTAKEIPEWTTTGTTSETDTTTGSLSNTSNPVNGEATTGNLVVQSTSAAITVQPNTSGPIGDKQTTAVTDDTSKENTSNKLTVLPSKSPPQVTDESTTAESATKTTTDVKSTALDPKTDKLTTEKLVIADECTTIESTAEPESTHEQSSTEKPTNQESTKPAVNLLKLSTEKISSGATKTDEPGTASTIVPGSINITTVQTDTKTTAAVLSTTASAEKTTTGKPITSEPITEKSTETVPASGETNTKVSTTNNEKPSTAIKLNTDIMSTTAQESTDAPTAKSNEQPATSTPKSTITTAPTSTPTPTSTPKSVPTTSKPSKTTVVTARPRPMSVKPTTKKPKRKLRKVCKGRGIYKGYQYDIYCKLNCNHNPPHCPRSVCACRYV